MPDKPTKKKLTFIEWVAKEENVPIDKAQSMFLAMYHGLIYGDGSLHSACDKKIGSSPGCSLCWLEGWLTKYHKYFKQK